MKNSIGFGLLIIISFNLFSQSTISQGDKKWSIGIQASPALGYRTMDIKKGSEDFAAIKTYFDSVEVMMPVFSFGIEGRYAIAHNLNIGVGVNYEALGYQTNYIDYKLIIPTVDLPNEYRFVHKFHYLSIPVFAEYKFGENKFKGVLSAGLAMNFLLKATTIETEKDPDGFIITHEESPNEDGLRNITASGFISAGVLYDISEKMHLEIAPFIKSNITRINEESTDPINEYLWHSGIKAGFFIDL